jgi:endonuclease YncB( thermonuclease family)
MPRLLMFIVALTGLSLVAPAAWAHKGSLDDLGCHKDRQSSYYHCHEGLLKDRKFAQKTGAKRAIKKINKEAAAAEAAALMATPKPATVTPLAAAPEAYGPYRASLVRVVDGSQLDMDLHIWPGQVTRVVVALDGVTSPSLDGEACEQDAALAAKKFVDDWVATEGALEVSGVTLAPASGRVLARVSRVGDDLAEAVIAAGHGTADESRPWCPAP